MTITLDHAQLPLETAEIVDDHRPSRVLQLLGAACMAAAPVLLLAGAATTPPQTDGSAEAYIDSLGNDPLLTAVSANFFHYSMIAFAFAALAAIGLVRGRRGRALTIAGGLIAAFGSMQFAGVIYNDWVLEALDNELTMAQAVSVFEHVNSTSSIAIWMLTAKVFGLLGFPVLFAGLARAGVISWLLVPLSFLPMVAFGVIGGALGIAVGLLCYAPNFVVSARLLQRAQLRR